MAKEVWVGTSGWSYAHWDTVFYPKEAPANQHLKFYSDFFNTVEINTTFYHLPLPQTVKNWYKQVPPAFLFSIKASRYITHTKRLLDSADALKNFYTNIKYLKEKTGPILFQLPPSFALNLQRLEDFIALLDSQYAYTFEFRHPTWYTQKVYSLLKSHNIALCVTDLNGTLSPVKMTADFAYVRLHGPKAAYRGRYSEEKLLEWKKQIQIWSKKGQVFLYFDNDEKSYAVKDGLALKDLLFQ